MDAEPARSNAAHIERRRNQAAGGDSSPRSFITGASSDEMKAAVDIQQLPGHKVAFRRRQIQNRSD
jgi:hypothetical protein